MRGKGPRVAPDSCTLVCPLIAPVLGQGRRRELRAARESVGPFVFIGAPLICETRHAVSPWAPIRRRSLGSDPQAVPEQKAESKTLVNLPEEWAYSLPRRMRIQSGGTAHQEGLLEVCVWWESHLPSEGEEGYLRFLPVTNFFFTLPPFVKMSSTHFLIWETVVWCGQLRLLTLAVPHSPCCGSVFFFLFFF